MLLRWLPYSLLLFLLSTLTPPSAAGDSINPATPLTDGETIVSTGGTFELGFFSPENSNNRYIGIWYHNIPVQTVVWVANRATPIPDKTGVLTLSSNGTLVLSNASNTTFWSSSSSLSGTSSTVAQLLDSGNLVVRAAGWQSFDYPTDTLLAGMKLGGNLTGGLNRNLTAWETTSDPFPGQYTFRMEPQGLPEFFLYRGSSRIYSSGPWNGLQLSGVPDLKSDGTFTFSYVSNQYEAYYTYHINNPSTISRLVLNETGVLQRYVWLGNVTGWSLFWTDPKEPCDTYATCGPFGFCNSNDSPNCNCVQGFEPKSQQEWNLRDATSGCVRKTRLNCQSDGFLLMKNMKLPQSKNASENPAVSLDQCKELCSKNCSCTAYASADVSGGGGGCIIWVGALIDLQEFAGSGQDLYIRLAASDLLSLKNEKSGKKGLAIGLGTTASALLLLGVVGYCMQINNAKRGRKLFLPSGKRDEPITFLARNYSVLGSAKDRRLDSNRSSQKDLDVLLFDMVTIMAATENFTLSNKLGEGGFGPVYKGKLGDGQEIAVKRLARTSTQGLDEFKNEVILIAKLQHRNLVRLLGCCIHGEEKMLVYEFMHNRSLDTFIFDETKRAMLNWQRRFHIILGIARGLLYLHQDSRLRIIHRDLKASNVLLDGDMNPKISDFGMARIFGGNQTDAYTRRVVGTYGYMSPEYAMDGIFSMKSDVFSFGVLVLEIVSGKKNRGMFQSDPLLNLLRHTWRLWKEGKSLELLDESMGGSYIASEVLTCIHVSLLCVQERASDRPTMASVTMMLSSETSNFQQPNEPGFIFSNKSSDTKLSSNDTVNGITVTTMDAR